jgi:spore coat protein U-like protein
MNAPVRCRKVRASRWSKPLFDTSLRVLFMAGLTATPALAAPTCTIASGATLSFGAVVALASTGDVTTNSGTSLWVNCNSDVTAAPALYSATPRTLVSGGNSLPFALSAVSPGGAELPAASAGAPLAIARDGTNHTVTLYGRIAASDFRMLPAGAYSRAISLTLEY